MSLSQFKLLIDRLNREPKIPDKPTDDDIHDLRSRIDEIDSGLLALLNERSRTANIIGKIKRKLGLPIYVPKREEQVLDNMLQSNGGPLPDASVRRLFERIIDETRSLERQKYQNESDK